MALIKKNKKCQDSQIYLGFMALKYRMMYSCKKSKDINMKVTNNMNERWCVLINWSLVLLFITTSIFMNGIHAQIQKNEIIIPPNTTANKFESCNTDKPNLYNGAIGDDILLYEIKLKGFSMPIILNHNYCGFKPRENSSWVGLGWEIMVGGNISRIVYNTPDDYPSGYENVCKSLNIPDPIKTPADYQAFWNSLTKPQLKLFAEGVYDGQPDEFILSGNNLNSKLIKLKDGRIVTIPYKPIDIQVDKNNWIVRDEDGNTYYYGASSDGNKNMNEQTYSETIVLPDYGGDVGYSYVSKYMLVKIRTSMGDSILFNYEEETVTSPIVTSETQNYYIETYSANPKNLLLPYSSLSKTTTIRDLYRITSIITPKEEILFNKGSLRKDVNSQNSYILKDIEVRDKEHRIIKGWKFYSSYMGNSNNYSQCRLLLDSVSEFGLDKVKTKPSYVFLYEKNNAIPDYETKGIDHWGFYNGANNNKSLIPSYLSNSNYNFYFKSIFTNRTPNHEYSKIGLLKTIQYPLNGTSTYLYEPNTYGHIDNELVQEIVYENAHIDLNASGTTNTIIKTNSFSITNDQFVKINYVLNPNTASSGGNISMDQDPVYLKIGILSQSTNKYYKEATTKKISGTDSIYLTSGSYVVEVCANISQSVGATVYYMKEMKDSQGNSIIDKKK
ncbi:MAG: hypothetical protein QM654_18160 [Dysgonamonadaceae bacterium]